MFKLITLGLLILALGVGIGTYYQKDRPGGIGPDSIWYNLDRAGEWAELNLVTWNESRRLELRLELMQERIDEFADLANVDRLTSEYAGKIEQEYEKLAQETKDALVNKAKDAADLKTQELLSRMEQAAADQQTALHTVIQNAPDAAENAFETTLGAVRKTVKEALELTAQRQ